MPYFTVLHLVSHVESRYSLTARPALFIYAGIAVAALLARVAHAWGSVPLLRPVPESQP